MHCLCALGCPNNTQGNRERGTGFMCCNGLARCPRLRDGNPHTLECKAVFDQCLHHPVEMCKGGTKGHYVIQINGEPWDPCGVQGVFVWYDGLVNCL